MAGIVISQFAEQQPDKIKTLVYLRAYLLSCISILDVGLEAPDSLVPPNLVIWEDRGVCEIKSEGIREIFYADCSKSDFDSAKNRICPELVLRRDTSSGNEQSLWSRSSGIHQLFNLAVAFDLSIDHFRNCLGRPAAASTFHHFCDYNRNPATGCPRFVTEPPGNGMVTEPQALSDIHTYVHNLVL